MGETMSGRDLLAVLAMSLPSFLLIALIAISSLAPPNFVATPQGTVPGRNTVGKKADQKKDRAAGNAPATGKQPVTTQDLIRDFWGRPYCASCVQVSEPAHCNSSVRGDERSCF